MRQPDEIADVMLFLSSPQAGYLPGQLGNTDGDFSAWWSGRLPVSIIASKLPSEMWRR